MIINVHAGHNPDGKILCGAVGYIKESTEARRVKDLVISKLRKLGNQVYDCTVDNGTTESNQLTAIIKKCEEHNADLNVSIHFNAGANKIANGKTTGVEVFTRSIPNDFELRIAKNICDSIADLGFTNRGVKQKNFFVLRNSKVAAVLIECCFVDDPDDVQLYSAESMANSIVYGITGKMAEVETSDTVLKYHRVQVGAYTDLQNAIKMQKELKANGYDAIIVTY